MSGHWESYPLCEDGCRTTYEKNGHKLCCICKRIVAIRTEEDSIEDMKEYMESQGWKFGKEKSKCL